MIFSNKKSIKFLFVIFVGFLFFISTNSALSQEETFQPITVVPGVIDETTVSQPIEVFLQNIFNFLIGVAAVLAVVQITIGGIQYMTSNVAGSLESAKTKIRMAIIGLLLILSTVIILELINPDIIDITLTV